jgi:hypothetical protein
MTGPPLYRSLFGQLVEFTTNLVEEIKYRKYNFDQYQNIIRIKLEVTYDRFIKVCLSFIIFIILYYLLYDIGSNT